ncbi:hypothetical protein C0J52_00256 [Blattella germanica]|nr:hypothetical protein C0J52_00256 [Blattella germanica]
MVNALINWMPKGVHTSLIVLGVALLKLAARSVTSHLSLFHSHRLPNETDRQATDEISRPDTNNEIKNHRESRDILTKYKTCQFYSSLCQSYPIVPLFLHITPQLLSNENKIEEYTDFTINVNITNINYRTVIDKMVALSGVSTTYLQSREGAQIGGVLDADIGISTPCRTKAVPTNWYKMATIMNPQRENDEIEEAWEAGICINWISYC